MLYKTKYFLNDYSHYFAKVNTIREVLLVPPISLRLVSRGGSRQWSTSWIRIRDLTVLGQNANHEATDVSPIILGIILSKWNIFIGINITLIFYYNYDYRIPMVYQFL